MQVPFEGLQTVKGFGRCIYQFWRMCFFPVGGGLLACSHGNVLYCKNANSFCALYGTYQSSNIGIRSLCYDLSRMFLGGDFNALCCSYLMVLFSSNQINSLCHYTVEMKIILILIMIVCPYVVPFPTFILKPQYMIWKWDESDKWLKWTHNKCISYNISKCTS